MESDAVRRWALEFLLRSPFVADDLIEKVLPIIPVSDADSRLKKTLLLRALQYHVFALSIPEPLLQILEILEEFHRIDGSPVTAAMSAAYCAVAVECTLKYLQLEDHGKNPFYFNAVERIWRARVPHMNRSGDFEGSLMFTEELKRWSSDIEASLSDSQLRERLASIDTRRDAIIKLRVYLAEEWANLGPSFLEVAASVHTNKAPTTEHLEAQHQHQEREIQDCSNAADEQIPLATTIEVQKVGECASSGLQTLVKDSLLNSSEVNEEAHVEEQSRDADIPCPDVINNNEADMAEKDQAPVPHIRVQKPSLMEENTAARIYEWDESIDGMQGGTSNPERRFHLPSPKVRKLSPLKKYVPTKITMRRRAKKWSPLEMETLKTAVDKFGKGNWKIILNSHKDIFEERTEVDLKDKWRNMTRYGSK
ncbi:uncharacterized protein LOC109817184 isoform X2 [Cajanus cajan]|uniref:uncharacterized protein LOC109817184 isoform X2 n=1 Tax=Cajanus cajan TaxID=3821 RepID=UPI00098D8EFF|nr:uncharacterized protein LOC109817184 isoform X2 [Cajanus cajan]